MTPQSFISLEYPLSCFTLLAIAIMAFHGSNPFGHFFFNYIFQFLKGYQLKRLPNKKAFQSEGIKSESYEHSVVVRF